MKLFNIDSLSVESLNCTFIICLYVCQIMGLILYKYYVTGNVQVLIVRLPRLLKYPTMVHFFDLTDRYVGTVRVHNARHKNVTSALNTTFFKTSGLYFFVYAHLGSTTELHKLMIFICFELLKNILVSPF